ncbi:hypothetical protein NYZ99_19620 [Maribacter litopenaei]|uniref:Beta/Gamma crystallin n=1 Tax=Maribacter litopenaei TaxID=2976127 RepID=A0ABY5Y7Q7_9FLAO|nr:hypothetical protein [Maribacter litopenaei]UWX54918.1 hypothetical protein NYZ99_19620 [Maribacter litopenaei]
MSPQNTDSSIPSLSLVNNFTDTSDYIFRNNSYFKIRNMQVGYSLPTDVIGKMAGMTGLRVYLQGENLFWFTPKGYIGADPGENRCEPYSGTNRVFTRLEH